MVSVFARLSNSAKISWESTSVKRSYPANTELYDPATGTWSFAGALAAGRDGHSATLLPSGKVLVVGGRNGSELNSVQLYDPVAGSWTAAASLGSGFDSHTATLLPNGKVLVAGGYGGVVLQTALLYDVTNKSWAATGSLNSSRYGNTATLLANGKVLVAGGIANNQTTLGSAELYDPTTGTWTLAPYLNVARVFAEQIQLPNHQVLITGGKGVGGIYDGLSSAELFVSTAINMAPITLTGAARLSNGAFQFSLPRIRKAGSLATPSADDLGPDKACPTLSYFP